MNPRIETLLTELGKLRTVIAYFGIVFLVSGFLFIISPYRTVSVTTPTPPAQVFTQQGTQMAVETSLTYVVAGILILIGFIVLLRKRKQKHLTFVLGIVAIISMVISGLVALAWLQVWEFIVVIGVTLGLFAYGVFAKSRPMLNIPLTCWAIFVSVTLPLVLPISMTLIFPAIFAVYDIFAVFKGPLKWLIKAQEMSIRSASAPVFDATQATPVAQPESLKATLATHITPLSLMMVRLGDRWLGLGDVIMYSLLELGAFILGGAALAAVVFVGLIVGIYLTYLVLDVKKLKAMPGLPIPTALALTIILICISV